MTTVAAQIICLEKAHLGYGGWVRCCYDYCLRLAKNKSNIQTKTRFPPSRHNGQEIETAR